MLPSGREESSGDGRREANESVEIGSAWAPHGGGVGLRWELHAGRGHDYRTRAVSPDRDRESHGAVRLKRYGRVELPRCSGKFVNRLQRLRPRSRRPIVLRVRARRDARYRRFPTRSAVSEQSPLMVCTRRRRQSPIQPRFLIVATSCIKSNAFATFTVTIDSGITVQVTPPTASMGPGEHFQFTATVSGTANTAVVWLVNNIPGGNATDGFVCPSSAVGSPCTHGDAPGEYFAPSTSPGVGDRDGAIRRRSDASGVGDSHGRKRQCSRRLRPRIRSNQRSPRKAPRSRTCI